MPPSSPAAATAARSSPRRSRARPSSAGVAGADGQRTRSAPLRRGRDGRPGCGLHRRRQTAGQRALVRRAGRGRAGRAAAGLQRLPAHRRVPHRHRRQRRRPVVRVLRLVGGQAGRRAARRGRPGLRRASRAVAAWAQRTGRCDPGRDRHAAASRRPHRLGRHAHRHRRVRRPRRHDPHHRGQLLQRRHPPHARRRRRRRDRATCALADRPSLAQGRRDGGVRLGERPSSRSDIRRPRECDGSLPARHARCRHLPRDTYLAEAVASCLAQDYEDLEVLVVVDGAGERRGSTRSWRPSTTRGCASCATRSTRASPRPTTRSSARAAAS